MPMKSLLVICSVIFAPATGLSFNEPADFMGIKFFRPIAERSMPVCRSRIARSGASERPQSGNAENDLAESMRRTVDAIRSSRPAPDEPPGTHEAERLKAAEEY